MFGKRKTEEEKKAFAEQYTTRVYCYKLKPNQEQEQKLSATLETCRRLYNTCLEEKEAAWRDHGVNVKCIDLRAKHVKERRKTDPFLSQVNSQILQDVPKRLDKAYTAYFKRLEEWKANPKGDKPGRPRWKPRQRYNSFTNPRFGHDGKQVKKDNPHSKYGHVHLPGIGWIKMFHDRYVEGEIRLATFIRKADGWHVRITCVLEKQVLEPTGQSVGIDLGIESFATLSTGEHIENPRYYKKGLARQAHAQRRLSRREGPDKRVGKRPSRRWVKAVQLLRKQNLHVANQRKEFQRRLVHDLVSKYDQIAVENLNIHGMVKNHCLAQHISDAGWGQFVSMLEAKAESAGRKVTKVDPAYTSQDCSDCGKRVPKKLSERHHHCPYCGVSLHRDVNAALNIKKRAESSAFGDGSNPKPRTTCKKRTAKTGYGELPHALRCVLSLTQERTFV